MDNPNHNTEAADVGQMDNECTHCGALLFDGELKKTRFDCTICTPVQSRVY